MCALFKPNCELAAVCKQELDTPVFSPLQFHCMSLRIEISKTSYTRTAPGSKWTLCFCWEVALYMLSEWTLYVALSRSCAYCMRCSNWKWGLKRTLHFILEPFLVIFKSQKKRSDLVWYSFKGECFCLIFCVIVWGGFLCSVNMMINSEESQQHSVKTAVEWTQHTACVQNHSTATHNIDNYLPITHKTNKLTQRMAGNVYYIFS